MINRPLDALMDASCLTQNFGSVVKEMHISFRVEKPRNHQGDERLVTIVHFDIPADIPDRAKNFYTRLFGWKFTTPPGYPDFFLIETADEKGRPGIGGGLGKRGEPVQDITVYIGVDSVEKYLALVRKEGGKVLMPYTPVPGYGALAICTDTEGNRFGLWESAETS